MAYIELLSCPHKREFAAPVKAVGSISNGTHCFWNVPGILGSSIFFYDFSSASFAFSSYFRIVRCIL